MSWYCGKSVFEASLGLGMNALKNSPSRIVFALGSSAAKRYLSIVTSPQYTLPSLSLSVYPSPAFGISLNTTEMSAYFPYAYFAWSESSGVVLSVIVWSHSAFCLPFMSSWFIFSVSQLLASSSQALSGGLTSM